MLKVSATFSGTFHIAMMPNDCIYIIQHVFMYSIETRDLSYLTKKHHDPAKTYPYHL